MSQIYTYRRPVQGKHYHHFRRILILLVITVLLIGGVVGYLYYQSTKAKPAPAATANPEDVIISGSTFTTKSDYFKFTDTGKWVQTANGSSDGKFVYVKYVGNELQHSLNIYVNKQPPATELEATYALPVRLVNNNSFQATTISNHCGKYTTVGGDIHPVSVNGTSIICRADSPQYVVAVGLIDGDQKLPLQRPDKTPISFWILYRDAGRNPDTSDLIRVIGSFQAL